MNIRKLSLNEDPPLHLLLLADPSEEKVRGYLQRGKCIIAERDEQMIGVYVLLPTNTDVIELVNVAIAENHQNQGLGKQLISHAIKTAKSMGFTIIEAGTGNSSINQLALYQKCGFRIVGVYQDYFINNYHEEIFENGIQCKDMIRLSQNL